MVRERRRRRPPFLFIIERAAGTSCHFLGRGKKDKEMCIRDSYKPIKQFYHEIVQSFAALPRQGEQKPRVGIVGEIYVKYSPLGNNHLEDFLASEGAEVVVPGLLDFCLYCVYNNIHDRDLYGGSLVRQSSPAAK